MSRYQKLALALVIAYVALLSAAFLLVSAVTLGRLDNIERECAPKAVP